MPRKTSSPLLPSNSDDSASKEMGSLESGKIASAGACGTRTSSTTQQKALGREMTIDSGF